MNNINWKELISSEYWFGIDRAAMHLTDKIILYFGIGLVVLAIVLVVLKLLSKNDLTRPVYNRVISVFFTVGLLEMFWFLLRSQYVNALGSRLAALVIGVIGLIYLYKPAKYLLTQYKKDSQVLSKQQLKEKYLQSK